MKKFIITYRYAKTFNRNMYYCNKRKRYFYLGHEVPNKCCDLVKQFNTNPVQEILLNQIK